MFNIQNPNGVTKVEQKKLEEIITNIEGVEKGITESLDEIWMRLRKNYEGIKIQGTRLQIYCRFN